MKVYSVGDNVYLFCKEDKLIIGGVVTAVNYKDDKITYNVYIRQGEFMMLGNIPTEWLFSSYEKCLNYAADLYKEEISINTSTTMESLPYGLRYGDIDPLVDLIEEFLISKKDLIGIQIGSYAGESTSLFLRSGVFKTLYCIDPWECGYDNNDLTSDKQLIAAEQIFDKHFKDNKIIKKNKSKIQ